MKKGWREEEEEEEGVREGKEETLPEDNNSRPFHLSNGSQQL